MAKTKYFAVDALGNTHTRNSDRVYTHMVVVRVNLKRIRDGVDVEREKRVWGKNWEFFAVEAGENPRYNRTEAQRVEYQAMVDLGREAYVQGKIDLMFAEIDARGAGDYEDCYRDFGWCGRLDLAQKLAKKWAHYGEVVILEAQK